MSGGGNVGQGGMQPPSWGGPSPSINPMGGNFTNPIFSDYGPQMGFYQPQQNFQQYVGGSDGSNYDRTVGYPDFPYQSIPSTGYTGPMGGNTPGQQRQPISSGPTQPIVSKSASMRSRPYVLNYSDGGISSLVRDTM